MTVKNLTYGDLFLQQKTKGSEGLLSQMLVYNKVLWKINEIYILKYNLASVQLTSAMSKMVS